MAVAGASLRSFLFAEAGNPPAPHFRGPRDKYGLFRAVSSESPSEIAHVLASASGDTEFLRSIPSTTWTELLRYFSPDAWLVRPAEHLRGMLRPVRGSGLPERRALLNALAEVVRVRRAAGLALTLSDYKALLSHSRELKHARMAQSLLQDMRTDGVTPDIDCWNSFAHAILHDDSQRMEIVRLPLKKKDKPKFWDSGALADVIQVFQHIAKTPGVEPDLQAYCAYLIALAREGDFGTIHTVLKEVWALDVQDDPSEWRPPSDKDYPDEHRLRPNARLLTTIAEIFGARDELSTALRFIDRLSSFYGLRLEMHVWRTLLMWTWIHARLTSSAVRDRRRHMQDKKQAADESQFFDPAEIAGYITQRAPSEALATFSSLLESFKSHGQATRPHHMEIPHMEFNNQLGQHVTGTPAHLAPLRQGLAAYMTFSRAYGEARSAAYRLLEGTPRGAGLYRRRNAGSIPAVTSSAAADVKLAAASMHRAICRAFLSSWARQAVEEGVPDSYVADAPADERARLRDWRLRGIPRFIPTYLSFLPPTLRYQVPGGTVHLVVRAADERPPVLWPDESPRTTVGGVV